MYHFVYLTRNLINNKIYVGKHSSSTIDPTYKGSGRVIKDAFKKYGWENFERHILYFARNDVEAYEIESWIVDEAFVKRNDTYNLVPGGCGARSGKYNPNYDGKITKQESVRNKIKQSLHGNEPSNKQFFKLVSPDGKEYNIHSLSLWCNHLLLSQKHLKTYMNKTVPHLDIPKNLFKSDAVQRLMNTNGWKLIMLDEKPKSFSELPSTKITPIKVSSKMFTFTDPSGNVYKSPDIQSFCNKMDLSRKHLVLYLNQQVPPLEIPPGLRKKETIRRLKTTTGWSLRIEKAIVIST